MMKSAGIKALAKRNNNPPKAIAAPAKIPKYNVFNLSFIRVIILSLTVGFKVKSIFYIEIKNLYNEIKIDFLYNEWVF